MGPRKEKKKIRKFRRTGRVRHEEGLLGRDLKWAAMDALSAAFRKNGKKNSRLLQHRKRALPLAFFPAH